MAKERKLQTVDDTCSICLREHKGTYTMKASCFNCGAKYMVKLSKGHPTSSGIACPECGVSYRVNYGERVA